MTREGRRGPARPTGIALARGCVGRFPRQWVRRGDQIAPVTRPGARAMFLILGVAGLIGSGPSAHAVQWLGDLDRAREEARLSDRILLIAFCAGWHAPCAAMDERTWNRPIVESLAEKFVCARVAFDPEGPLASWFRVETIPCVLFVGGSDRVLLRLNGYWSAEEMAGFMQPLPESRSEIDSLAARGDEKDASAELLVELADRFHHQGMHSLSNEFYERASRSKVVKKDPLLREKVATFRALSRMADRPREASKALKRCLKEFPGAQYRRDQLAALVKLSLLAGETQEARAFVETLKKEFPGDSLTESAARLVSGGE